MPFYFMISSFLISYSVKNPQKVSTKKIKTIYPSSGDEWCIFFYVSLDLLSQNAGIKVYLGKLKLEPKLIRVGLGSNKTNINILFR